MKENELIAEFMGLSHCEEGWITIPNENRNGVSEDEISNDLQYHTSWDWLIPVVDKCYKTGDDTHQWDDLMDAMFTCDISIVHTQVVEFIKENNDEKN